MNRKKNDRKQDENAQDQEQYKGTDPQEQMKGPVSSAMHETGEAFDTEESRVEAEKRKAENQ